MQSERTNNRPTPATSIQSPSPSAIRSDMCKPTMTSDNAETKTVAASSPSSSSKPWLVNAWNVVVSKYKAGQLSWTLVIYLSFVHIVAIIGLFAIPYCQAKTLIFAFILWPITGAGITVGAHRLWAHRSYEASLPVRIVLMLCNSMANQRSIYHWSRDHRVHHKYSETTADPHDATRGFFFAHIGWLLILKHPDVGRLGKKVDFSDLLDDPVVRFQEFLDPWFAAYMCFILPAQIASYFWGETFWLGFLVPGGLRYCYVLHCTFLVNSAAHLYGDHPYDAASHPAENPVVSWFAIGEGWHNWHHKYPYDYATSEFGVSSQYNPSKLIIDAMAALGLVWGRKRAVSNWAMGMESRARRDQQAKRDATANDPAVDTETKAKTRMVK